MGAKKLLVAFLEKDNIKLLVYDLGGKAGATRSFAGQITFSPEVVKEAFIADPAKFTGQLKIAFNQKPELSNVFDVVLFVPPDKVFTKALPVSDSVETFIRTLPYFKEELIIDSLSSQSKSKETPTVTYVAFERKLVEDFQRPFLESGKKVVGVASSLNVLSVPFKQEGRYFLLAAFDKDVTTGVVQAGTVEEIAQFPREVFVNRFGEFVVSRNLTDVRLAYTVGSLPGELTEKIRADRGIEVRQAAAGDIYDLTVAAYKKQNISGSFLDFLPKFDFSKLSIRFPGQRYLFLAGAVIVGFALVFLVVKNISSIRLPGVKQPQKPAAPVMAPPAPLPAPEPKPGDFKVRVLNGTLVEGEAGRLADKLKGLGFNVTETKNATSAGFVATRLRTAADVPAKIVDSVKSVLVDTYDSIILEPLASDSAGVKIEIIIGKKK